MERHDHFHKMFQNTANTKVNIGFSEILTTRDDLEIQRLPSQYDSFLLLQQRLQYTLGIFDLGTSHGELSQRLFSLG
jgi:hypothetical protein